VVAVFPGSQRRDVLVFFSSDPLYARYRLLAPDLTDFHERKPAMKMLNNKQKADMISSSRCKDMEGSREERTSQG